MGPQNGFIIVDHGGESLRLLCRRPACKWGCGGQADGREADAALLEDAYGRRQRGRSDLVMIGWVAAEF